MPNGSHYDPAVKGPTELLTNYLALWFTHADLRTQATQRWQQLCARFENMEPTR